MKRHHVAALLMALAALGLCACAGVKPKSPPPPDVAQLDAQSFSREIHSGSGLALVLFYNDAFPQSREMVSRLNTLAAKYKGKARCYSFFWELDSDSSAYKLEMLPTLVMYKDGKEVDRMRGIPSERAFQESLGDDLELWLLRTGMGLSRDQYHGDFIYRFNNTSRLGASN
jgi:thioredoxin-like negative regulator of GroEL